VQQVNDSYLDWEAADLLEAVKEFCEYKLHRRTIIEHLGAALSVPTERSQFLDFLL
jgi:hypothetical protein